MKNRNLNPKIIVALAYSCLFFSLLAGVVSMYYKYNFIPLVNDVRTNPLFFLGLAITNSLWTILYSCFLLEIYNGFYSKDRPVFKIFLTLLTLLVIFTGIVASVTMIKYLNIGNQKIESSCDNATGAPRIGCLVSLAISKNDPNICKLANDPYGLYTEKYCFLQLAETKKDKAICDFGFAADSEYKGFCYSKIAESGAKNLTTDDCKINNSMFSKRYCIADVIIGIAAEKKDASVCGQINNELHEFIGQPNDEGFNSPPFSQKIIDTTIDYCYQGVAEKTGDSSICAKIKNIEVNGYTNQQDCYRGVSFFKK